MSLPIRFSSIDVDRLNKAFVQIRDRLDAMEQTIKDLGSILAKATANPAKPDYPGLAAGSKAIINGPVPGGPTPLPPWVPDHAMLVAEGSKPVKPIIGTDGQVPIACGGQDPAFADIQAQLRIHTTGLPTLNGGITIVYGCNYLAIDLTSSLATFIADVATALGLTNPL